jgi:acetyl esterase/lipase
MQKLDPELALLLDKMPRFDFASVEELAAARDAISRLPQPAIPSTVQVERRAIGWRDDGTSIDVLVYRPAVSSDSLLPCVYWMHGGGYVMGMAEVDPRQLTEWVEGLPCVIVSVEYQLAPEAPFPAALDEAFLGLRWVADHAVDLHVDPHAIALAGASAGAGLCAALARHARDQIAEPPALQLLYYPMLDDRMTTPSTSWDVPVWGRKANAWSWRAYLGDDPADDVAARAASGRASVDDLRGLPSTFIAVGSADMFVHEDLDYATNLLAAGVPTEVHVYPGAPHGFNSMFPESELGRRANRDALDALQRAFAEVVRRSA